jgi:hypothetical protein
LLCFATPKWVLIYSAVLILFGKSAYLHCPFTCNNEWMTKRKLVQNDSDSGQALACHCVTIVWHDNITCSLCQSYRWPCWGKPGMQCIPYLQYTWHLVSSDHISQNYITKHFIGERNNSELRCNNICICICTLGYNYC